MKKLTMIAMALAGVTAYASINTALDNTALTFTTGGGASWFEQTADVKVGKTALRSGAITDGEETWIETTVPSAGMLSFWWKVSSESVNWDWLEVSVDGEQKAKIGGTGDGWSKKNVFVAAGQTVRWKYLKDDDYSSGQDCGWLDGVEFASAPESMAVTFVTNGGGDIAPTNVAPGATYGELPVPEDGASGRFLGWYLDEGLTEMAANGDLIVYRDVTLYAKWVKYPSVLDTEFLQFYDEGDANDGFWAPVTSGGGYSLRLESLNAYANAELLVVVPGNGTLSFRYRLLDEDSCLDVYTSNGNCLELEGPQSSWQSCRLDVFAPDPGHEEPPSVSFCGDAASGRVLISDFEWTPAPETVTFTFDPRGGTPIEPLVLDCGSELAGALPDAEREGWTFVGWAADGEDLSDLVPFHDVLVHADWIKPLDAMNTDKLVFSSEGASTWTDLDCWGENPVANAPLMDEDDTAVSPDDELDDVSSCMKAVITGPAVVSFDWHLDIENAFTTEDGVFKDSDSTRQRCVCAGEIYALELFLDDEFVCEFTPGSSFEDWCQSVDVGGEGDHTLRWELSGMPAVVVLERWDDVEGKFVEVDDGYRLVSPGMASVCNIRAKTPVCALDTDDISFSASEDWSVVAGAGATGGDSLCYWPESAAYYQWGQIEACVPGRVGVLSFKWRADVAETRGGCWSFYYESGDNFLGLSTANTWRDVEVLVTGPDEEDGDYATIRWHASIEAGSDSGSRMLISDVVWTPAPESVTIAFDANGGGEVAPVQRAPLSKYGKLPVPVRNGYKFLGWCVGDAFGDAVLEATTVPLHDVALCAKWADPKVTIFPAQLTGGKAAGAAAAWRQVTPAPGAGPVLEAEVYGTLDKTMFMGVGLIQPGGDSAYQVSFSRAGYLSFDWMVSAAYDQNAYYKGGSVKMTLLLDGKPLGDEITAVGGSVGGAVVPAGWATRRVYLPSGKHTLKWQVTGISPFDYEIVKKKVGKKVVDDLKVTCTAPSYARIRNIAFEPAGAQPDIAAWTDKLRRFNSWTEGDLSRFAAQYRTRMLINPDDYEARVFHAVTTLGALAENQQFKTFAKTFGYTVDWARMSFTGSLVLNKNTAAANTVVDKTLALAVPVLKGAIADLSGIPEDWDGSVHISSDEWPIDEDVEMDIADVMFARAGLNAALASLNYLAAHDLTVDWTKAAAAGKLASTIPVVKAVPAIGDGEGWNRNALAFRAADSAVNGAMLIKGTSLYTRLSLGGDVPSWSAENQVQDLYFSISSGDTVVMVAASLFGERGYGHSYGTETNVSCRVYNTKGIDLGIDSYDEYEAPATVLIRAGELVFGVNLNRVKNFAKKKWTVDSGYVLSGSWDGLFGELTQNSVVSWSGPSDRQRVAQKMIVDQKAFFSKVRDASRLGASGLYFRTALETALRADVFAAARSGDEPMHFVEYSPDDEKLIGFARANTERALAALDAPVGVDFAQVAADFDEATGKDRLARYDYTLLPGEDGLTKVYLGALFEGRITRALLPSTRLNSFGEIVPNFEGMADPTIGGLFPEMTRGHISSMSQRFGASHEMDKVDWDTWTDPATLPVPGEKVDITYSEYIGYAASGLPKGWKWDKNKGRLTGTASSSFSLALTKKGQTTVKIPIEVGEKPAVLLFADDPDAVSVTGTGVYAMNSTVRAVAAVKAGHAFCGWYNEADELVSRNASYSFKMSRESVSLTARTAALSDDFLDAKTADEPYVFPVGAEQDLTPFYVYSHTPFSVSASGLPAGMKAEYVVESQDGRLCGDVHIKGTAAKAGVYYATLAAKNNGGFRRVHVVKLVVGEASENEVNTAGIDWSEVDEGGRLWTGVSCEYSVEVPASYQGSAPKSVKSKGLPGGLAAKLAGGRIVISGVPSVPGKFTMDFTVTYANKKTARSVKTVIVNDSGSVYIPTGVIDNDPDSKVRGTVTGGGVRHYGQSVKFTAATKDKKKWFFGGWYLDSGCEHRADVALPGVDYRSATLSAQIGDMWSQGDGMYALFVAKSEDSVAIVFPDEGNRVWRVEYDGESGGYSNYVVGVESVTKATLAAKGLPAGTKLSGRKLVVSKAASLVPGFYAVKLTATTASGVSVTEAMTVIVPNITTALDKGVVEGLNTSDDGYSSAVRPFMQAGVKQSFSLAEDLGVTVASGWTLTVTGLPKGWTYNKSTGVISGVATKVGKTIVTFTVSKKTGRKTTSYKATATFDLAPLPRWATGTFVGMVENNYCSLKRPVCWLDNAYVRMSVTSAGVVSGYFFDASVGKVVISANGFTVNDGVLSATLKGKARSYGLTIEPVENLGVEQGRATLATDIGDHYLLYNDPWGIDGAAPLPVFPAGAVKEAPVENGELTLKFGQNGVVTCVYTVGKYSTSGTTQICDIAWDVDGEAWTASVVVSMAAKLDKKKKVLVPAFVDAFRLYIPADDGVPNMDDMAVEPYDEW